MMVQRGRPAGRNFRKVHKELHRGFLFNHFVVVGLYAFLHHQLHWRLFKFNPFGLVGLYAFLHHQLHRWLFKFNPFGLVGLYAFLHHQLHRWLFKFNPFRLALSLAPVFLSYSHPVT
jgi:hypothetical protein